MNASVTPSHFEKLFQEKSRVLKAFHELTRDYEARFKGDAPAETKLDWVDQLSDAREQNIRILQILDQEIDAEKLRLNFKEVANLQSSPTFQATLNETLKWIHEIQLTDQSLFLYIHNMGFELRAQILRSLKEKEALSKFKSQTQTTGEGLDQTV